MYSYIDFDLHILKLQPDQYLVTAQAPDAGLAYGELNWNALVERDFATAVDQICSFGRTSAPQQLGFIGNTLSAALLTGRVRDLFLALLTQRVQPQDHTYLRLRLDIADNAPEVASLPWELLTWHGAFLATQVKTLVTRQLLNLDYGSIKPLSSTSKPRVLIVIPQGSGLGTDREEQAVVAALASGAIPYDVLKGAVSLQRVDDALSAEAYQILHFIGHGALVAVGEEQWAGMLRFNTDLDTDSDRTGEEWVLDNHLRVLLANHQTIRLVFLNACGGASLAEQSGRAGFMGTAPAILRAGVPAVIAMQYPVLDSVAQQFAQIFYQRLTAGNWIGQVDVAVTLARSACLLKFPDDPGFAAPVLYLRSSSGRIFDPGEAAIVRQTDTLAQALLSPRRSYISATLPDLSPELRYWVQTNRQQELALLLGHIASHRVTSVIGMGGIGKTTVVRTLIDQRPPQIPPPLWVDFFAAPDTTLDDLLSTVASYLEWPDLLTYQRDGRTPDRSDLLRLVAHLQQAEALWLIFDNLETILHEDGHFNDRGLADFFDLLTTRHHAAHLILTSRYLPVLPERSVLGAEWQRSAIELQGLAQDAAVSLLQAHGLGQAQSHDLVALAHYVEGHPLALRYLAVEAQTWGLADLLQEIDLLRPDLATLASRLLARLTSTERQVLARLFVYRRPQPVKVLMHLAGGGRVGQQAIRRLIEKSLFTGQMADGTHLYRLHSLVQEFVAAETAPETRCAAHQTAHDFYLELPRPPELAWKSLADVMTLLEAHHHALAAGAIAQAAAILLEYALPKHLEDWGAQERLSRLCRQTFAQAPTPHRYDEYLASVGYTKLIDTQGDAQTRAKLYGQLGMVARYCNHYPEAWRLLKLGLALLATAPNARARIHLHKEAALILNYIGEYSQALEQSQAALATLDSVPASPRAIDHANLLTAAANALGNLNRFEEAVTTARAAHQAYLDAGYPARAFNALDNLGVRLYQQGLYAESLLYHREALEYFASTDNVAGRAGASVNLGASLYMLERFQEARAYYAQALPWFEACGDRRGMIVTLLNLGELLLDQDEPTAALPLLQNALTASENIGEKEYRPYVHYLIGRTYQRLGSLFLAHRAAQEALQLAQATHNQADAELAQRLLEEIRDRPHEAA